MSDSSYYVLVAAAIVIGLFIRCVAFSSVPGGVNQDEAMAAVDARALCDYGTDRLGMIYPVHFQAWGFGQMSVLLSYCMIPFIRLFGFSTLSIRLPMLLFSLMGIGALYLLSREVFNREIALVVLFLCAINPWQIVQSRWSLDCNLFPHVLIAGIALLNHSLRPGKSRVWLYLSMAVFGLSMYCYGISIYTVPVFLLAVWLLLYLLHKVSLKESGICLGVYLLLAWPFILMILINTFELPSIETSLFTIPYFPNTIRKGDILFFSEHPWEQFWLNVRSLWAIIFQLGNDSLCNVVPGFSTLYVFSVPFGILGFLRALRASKRSVGVQILLLYFLTAVFNGLITNNVNVNRENIIFYALIVFDALGIYTVLCSSRYLVFGVEILCTVAFTLFCATYMTSYASSISLEFNEDFGQALCCLDTSSDSPIYITPDVQAPGRSYVSEIYTLYWCDIDAKEYQSEGFRDKYHFYNPTLSIIKSNPDSQFVVPSSMTDLFDRDVYTVSVYGRYACAVPRSGIS